MPNPLLIIAHAPSALHPPPSLLPTLCPLAQPTPPSPHPSSQRPPTRLSARGASPLAPRPRSLPRTPCPPPRSTTGPPLPRPPLRRPALRTQPLLPAAPT